MTTTHSNITALFSDIADKIRFKQGTSSSYVADAFPTAIETIGENWANRTIKTFPLSSGYSGVIGSYAFYGCTTMSGAVQTNSFSVSTYAFYNCYSITELNFPKLTSTATYAFYYCYRVNSTSFPLMKSIANYTFGYCSSLTTISLPSTTYIGNYAFRNCTRLISLYLLGSSICSLGGSNAFYSTPINGYSTTAGQLGSVYVPSSLYATYIASTYWSLISSQIVSV